MDVDVDYDHGPADAERLRDLYAQQSWWADRSAAEVRRALEHSDEAVGLRAADGELVASARVLTDYTVYARLYDVIVDEDHRGDGLGHRLVEAVIEHPDLDAVHSFELGCFEELVPFYESCGFRDNGPEFRTMVYQTQ